MCLFEVLGSNATAPTQDGPASSYLVSAGTGRDDGWILVDAGPGGMMEFCKRHELNELKAIVITHMHADHCLDLMALAYRWTFPERLPRIPLLVPLGGLEIVKRFDEIFGIPSLPGMRHPIETAWQCSELPADGIARPIANITVQAFPAHHAITSNALRFTLGGTNIAFSSDTCRCPGVELAADKADLLVCECTYLQADPQQLREHGHLTATQAGALGEDTGARHLLLTHFGIAGMQRQAERDAGAAYRGPLDIAVPGWTFPTIRDR